jgi:hypothetical protein
LDVSSHNKETLIIAFTSPARGRASALTSGH